MKKRTKVVSTQRTKEQAAGGSLRILILLFGALLLITAARLVWIQAIRGASLRQEVEDARVMPRTTPAQRGGIYDRDGIPLALSSTVYNVIADPVNMTQKGRAALVLTDVLGGSVDEYYEQMIKPTHYVVMARKITQAQRDMLIGFIENLPAETASEKEFKIQMQNFIVFELDYERTYPAETLAAQTIGWVRSDNGEGQAGIELYYNTLLKGKPGSSTSERDVFGNLIPSGVQKEMPAQAGQPIMLTLDYHIQSFADKEIAALVEARQAKAGAVIVMDVKTGELLAVSSYPSFDLNEYHQATEEAFRNRALVEVYEPGSTVKPITAVAALESGKITTQTGFDLPPKISIGIYDVSDEDRYDTSIGADLSTIIEHSSNVGTSQVAFTIGRESLYDGFEKTGLTTVPEIDFPYPKQYSAVIENIDSLPDIGLSNYSFGQGLAISPIMLVRAIGAIANNGVLVTPHLLKEAPGSTDVVPSWPTRQAISPEVAKDVAQMMENVMTIGTGNTITVEGFRIAGKTGTSQKAAVGQGYDTDTYIGSFIGFLPADNPEIIVFVMLDEPSGDYYGSRVAGPAFSSIAAFAAEHLAITQKTE
jgi:cell division protein FtsI/penicillin-binding protein 2